MWISKSIDILFSIIYISLVIYGMYLGFRKVSKISMYLIVSLIGSSVSYRIFKHFLIKDYLVILEIGIVILSSALMMWIFAPVLRIISDKIGNIKNKPVDRMVSLLTGIIFLPILIGYLVLISGLVPQFYNILETSSIATIFLNIVKYIIGIEII